MPKGSVLCCSIKNNGKNEKNKGGLQKEEKLSSKPAGPRQTCEDLTETLCNCFHLLLFVRVSQGKETVSK